MAAGRDYRHLGSRCAGRQRSSARSEISSQTIFRTNNSRDRAPAFGSLGPLWANCYSANCYSSRSALMSGLASSGRSRMPTHSGRSVALDSTHISPLRCSAVVASARLTFDFSYRARTHEILQERCNEMLAGLALPAATISSGRRSPSHTGRTCRRISLARRAATDAASCVRILGNVVARHTGFGHGGFSLYASMARASRRFPPPFTCGCPGRMSQRARFVRTIVSTNSTIPPVTIPTPTTAPTIHPIMARPLGR